MHFDGNINTKFLNSLYIFPLNQLLTLFRRSKAICWWFNSQENQNQPKPSLEISKSLELIRRFHRKSIPNDFERIWKNKRYFTLPYNIKQFDNNAIWCVIDWDNPALFHIFCTTPMPIYQTVSYISFITSCCLFCGGSSYKNNFELLYEL